MSGAGVDPRVCDLLRQAQEWRLLGLLFERPRGDWWEQVAALGAAREADDLRAAAEAVRDADESGFLALLGPGGLTSAREVGHRPVADPGHLLAELEAYYRAFAYAPLSEEPPDHVSVEAGFVGYLRLKEAYAVARGDSEAARVCHEAAERFVEEHLSACAEPLAVALDASGMPHLAGASRALFRTVGPRRAADGGWTPGSFEGCEGCAFP